MSKIRDILKEKSIFANRYTLIRNLGNGGFSEVWLADDMTAQIQVAIKIYVPDGNLDEEGAEMFRHEFSVVCNMNQTNLLRPFTFDIYDNHPYLVLPYCEKGSSSKLIGKLSENELWKYLYDVASGLEFLHNFEAASIVHQDIKPQNILITSNHYVITDFGISTKIRRTIRTSQKGDIEGGTIAYMGPERFSSTPDPIMASDMWSLGATLFEIITGQPPFGEHGGLLQKNGADIPEIKENLSPELKEIIYQCLAKETWDRPTAKELKEFSQLHIMGFSIDDTVNKTNSRLSHHLQDSIKPAISQPVSVNNEQLAKKPQDNPVKHNNGQKGNIAKKHITSSKKLIVIALIAVLVIGCGIALTMSGDEDKAIEQEATVVENNPNDKACKQEMAAVVNITKNAESKRKNFVDYNYEDDYIKALDAMKDIEIKYGSNVSPNVTKQMADNKRAIVDSLSSFSTEFKKKATELVSLGAKEAADKFISRSQSIDKAIK